MRKFAKLTGFKRGLSSLHMPTTLSPAAHAQPALDSFTVTNHKTMTRVTPTNTRGPKPATQVQSHTRLCPAVVIFNYSLVAVFTAR